MTTDYLPEWATLAEASLWLEKQTGERWPLPRILSDVQPRLAVWLDHSPEAPLEAFNGRHEGFLAELVFQGDVQRLALARDGLLTMTRRPDGSLLQVTPGARFDLNELRICAEDLRCQAGTIAPAQSAAPATDEPLPLSTSDIAHSFADLRWSEPKWRKPLGDKPKWLQACVAIPGQRGVSETRWNPVRIAAALVLEGHATAKTVRARFQTKHMLKPWLEAWQAYEAEYINSD